MDVQSTPKTVLWEGVKDAMIIQAKVRISMSANVSMLRRVPS